jgi:hypothetical protein
VNEQQAGAEGAGQAKCGGTGGASAKDGTAGSAIDAVAAIGAALAKAAEAKPADTADPTVSSAFALGWHMSELYERHLPAAERKPPDLPGLGSLTDKQQIAVLVDQVEAGVERIKDPISQAGLEPIDLSAIEALGHGAPETDPVLRTHVELLSELTAADFRVGKAYGLGRALADSCREPSDPGTVTDELDPLRIANLLRWLDDLATAFPPHAANSVSKSLIRWSDALHPPTALQEPGRWQVKAKWERLKARWDRWQKRGAISAPVDSKDAFQTLRRQGELWRALLSGEKRGTDMLEIDNYLDAARQVAARTAAIVRGVAVRMPLLAALVLGLVGVGIWLLAEGSSSQLVGGVTSVLVALGVTWKGLGGALGQLAGKLEQPLWGAVLDDAIADAITLLPSNTAETFGRRRVAMEMTGAGASNARDMPSG